MLDLRLLNYFLVVAREQNMTKAATHLHITQPTLSTQISNLETQLGIMLFKRTNKSTLLTDDGILFRARVQELLDLSNKIETEFSADDQTVSGDVYLGCAETDIMSYVIGVFKELKKEHPGIHLHLYSGDADAVLERLDKGLLDIGLLLGPEILEKYDYASLNRYDTFGLLVPLDSDMVHKEFITMEELKLLPVLVSRQTATGTHNLRDFDPQMLRCVGTYNLITNAAYMVEQGLGYALTLEKLINTEGRNLKFIPLEEEVKLEAYIVTKKHPYLSKAAKLFYRRLLDEKG